jgi:hypothetical protein
MKKLLLTLMLTLMSVGYGFNAMAQQTKILSETVSCDNPSNIQSVLNSFEIYVQKKHQEAIVKLAPGIYKISNPIVVGSGEILEGTVDKETGKLLSTIDAQNKCRCATVYDGNINDLNLVRGSSLTGGGVCILNHGQVNRFNVISNCIISGCVANLGGGIFAGQRAECEIENVVVTNCIGAYGGGIAMFGNSHNNKLLQNFEITNCKAASDGGGLFVNNFFNNTIVGTGDTNIAGNIAPLALTNPNLQPVLQDASYNFTGIKLSHNIAYISGGGACLNNSVINGSCCIDNNKAHNGGGILLHSSLICGTVYDKNGNPKQLYRSNIYDNAADLAGGGAYAVDSSIVNYNIYANNVRQHNYHKGILRNRNSVAYGGGLYYVTGALPGTCVPINNDSIKGNSCIVIKNPGTTEQTAYAEPQNIYIGLNNVNDYKEISVKTREQASAMSYEGQQTGLEANYTILQKIMNNDTSTQDLVQAMPWILGGTVLLGGLDISVLISKVIARVLLDGGTTLVKQAITGAMVADLDETPASLAELTLEEQTDNLMDCAIQQLQGVIDTYGDEQAYIRSAYVELTINRIVSQLGGSANIDEMMNATSRCFWRIGQEYTGAGEELVPYHLMVDMQNDILNKYFLGLMGGDMPSQIFVPNYYPPFPSIN